MELAGPAADAMAASYAEASRQLRSSESQVRRAALYLLAYHWRREAEFSGLCESLAFEDRDADVAFLAMGLLGECYHGSWDARIGRRLAEAVCDPSRPGRWRRAAYAGLLGIQARPQLDLRDQRFPEDADWDYVRSFFLESTALGENEGDASGRK